MLELVEQDFPRKDVMDLDGAALIRDEQVAVSRIHLTHLDFLVVREVCRNVVAVS